ncbi:MAG TPA: HAD family hydrolase [Pyrinomonadaceae bacterium]|nr:HAD family hydrolase [Pyrinomonadaceae bacterium]
MKRRAVFIDRDGTLSEEVGYINHPSRFRLFSYAAEAIKHLNDQGWLAVLTTNQAGVARGYFTEELISSVHESMINDLERGGARLDAIYYCAHHPSVGEPPYRVDCDCRKPKPGLITRAAGDLDINLNESWMVGDRYSDIEMARNAGVKSAFVLSGYGRGEWEHQSKTWIHKPDLVAENLLEAVELITSQTEINVTKKSALSGEEI